MDIEKAVTPEEMKGLEKRLIEAGIPSILLMENAAAGIARAVSTENQRCPVYIFCGRGNNGGDGLASARHLAALGFDSRIALLGTGSELKGDAKANLEMAVALGIPILEITEEAQLDSFCQGMQEGAIVDALLGTGLSKEVDGLYKTAIERMNSCGLPVYSADIPSGIDGETGRVMGAAVRAEATITFLCAKTGLLLYPGREYAGRLIIKDLGARLAGTKFHREFIPRDAAFPFLPPRKPDANKGSCGKLAIVAGSEGFAGAG
ncbi:MAG: NAD(P)H-hydrate epimerase, partial [Bacillota bacterium]|nr:NAD(P)H-hydrate epimerase [Bacillota bacterium]